MNTQLSPQSSMSVVTMTPYEEDSYTWMSEQLALLHCGQFDKLDFENLETELEIILAGEKSSIGSYLTNVLSHMLKWEYQPELRRYGNSSWEQTINNGRKKLRSMTDYSEGLKNFSIKDFPRFYATARKDAARETRMPLSTFPEICPWTYDQVTNLDLDFFPGIPVETPPVEKKRKSARKVNVNP